jgi:two-component sensor histidine kinase
MVSTVQDITERKQAEEKNKSLLAEKELILKEVNHRIKNNMNTMKGLLLLQATTMNEAAAKTALENASKRMQSMEILYDQLYQSAAFTELSIKSYLSPLIDAFIVSFPEGNLVKVEKHIDDFILDAKRLQPLGIIINELLTNIMKYAFTNKSKGIITVTVILEDAHVILSVQDNGKGIPASINFTNSTGFGLMLVHVLTGQLDGKIQIERVGGTRIVLDFEK